MIDAGYFAKRVAAKPEWLNVSAVHEICSAESLHLLGAGCRGSNLGCTTSSAGSIGHPTRWPSFERIRRAEFRLFAYRIYPQLFRSGQRHGMLIPPDAHPDPIPASFKSLGFDSVNKSMPSVLGFECSPLSCNSMAGEMRANEYCLFDSLEAAIAGATRFSNRAAGTRRLLRGRGA